MLGRAPFLPTSHVQAQTLWLREGRARRQGKLPERLAPLQSPPPLVEAPKILAFGRESCLCRPHGRPNACKRIRLPPTLTGRPSLAWQLDRVLLPRWLSKKVSDQCCREMEDAPLLSRPVNPTPKLGMFSRPFSPHHPSTPPTRPRRVVLRPGPPRRRDQGHTKANGRLPGRTGRRPSRAEGKGGGGECQSCRPPSSGSTSPAHPRRTWRGAH